MDLPILKTARLRLMSLHPQQHAKLAELGDDPMVAAYTASIPSPYTSEDAQTFIEHTIVAAERDENYVFGIHLQTDELMGVINLRPSHRHRSGHLGYWIGANFRNHGFMTEAVQGIMLFAFQTLGLHRVHTSCLAVNVASARVLEKAGLKREGCSKQAFLKQGIFHDLLQFGVVGDEWAIAMIAGSDAPLDQHC